MPALRRSASSASAMPGYWILTATLAAVEQLGAVHLADRGGGEGLLLELGEELGERLAVVLLLEHLLDLLPGHRRRVGAQLGELLLVDLAVLVGDELGVDEGGELAELHRRALHLAQRADHLQRGLQVALLEPLFAALLGAADVGRLGARVAGALHADDRAQLGRAPQAPLGDLGVFAHCRKVPTGRVGARFSILSRPHGSNPREAQGSTAQRFRLPHLPSPAARGPGARRRLQRRLRGARLPGRRTRRAQRARRRRGALRPRDRGRQSRAGRRQGAAAASRARQLRSTSTCRRCASTRRSRPR